MCKNNNPLYNRERREQARKANAKRGKTRVLPPHLQRRKTIHINAMDRDTYTFEVCLDEEDLKKVIKTYYV